MTQSSRSQGDHRMRELKSAASKFALCVILMLAAAPSYALECLTDFLEAADPETIQSVKKIPGLFEYSFSQVESSISDGLSSLCKGEFVAFESYGVTYPENQLSMASRAVFLALKYGGDIEVFLEYVGDDLSQWEDYNDHDLPQTNENCDGDFLKIGTRLHEWRSGRLFYRLVPVGVCPSDQQFWQHKEDAGWLPLNPYEKAEICVTLKRHAMKGLEYCEQNES